MMEIWKKINDTNYSVSSFGRVRSEYRVIKRSNGRQHTIESKVLKTAIDSGGYERCAIMVDGKLVTHKVHRLVAMVFHGPSNLEVNHIDGDKNNNREDNLEWCTRSENVSHAFKTGLAKPLRGSENPSSKICELQALTIKTLLMSWVGPLKIARDYGISKNITKDISRNKTWKHL